jgi:glycosyltransferase involved in cell wall biosynthesis
MKGLKMYSLNNDYVKNNIPWDIPLSSRCRILKQNIDKGHMISILLYEFPDNHTFRYRGYNIMQITQQNDSLFKCVFFFRHELKTLETFMHKVHLITIIRTKWNQELEEFIIKAKKINIKILFDIDDLVFDLNYLPLLYNTLNVNSSELDYDYWFAYFSRFYFTASKADGFITTNDYLGEMLRNKFQKDVRIIPNFLNQEQLEISENLCKQKENIKNTEPFTIGYFSGTPSHINDFKIIYKELLTLLSDYKMRLLVVGFMEFPQDAQVFLNNNQIIYTPLVDFIELQRQVAQVDVNIVPLVNNAFTNCKSELKYFEAAIVKTITLATPTFAYRGCIENGKTGYLCNEGEWYEKITHIYKNSVMKRDIENSAYDNVIQNYSGDIIIQKINEVYNRFLSPESF